MKVKSAFPISFKALLCCLGTITAVPVMAQVKPAAHNYQITAQIANLGNEKVYLNTTYNGKELKDSTIAKNGAFSFKGKTPGTLVYGLRLGKKYMALAISPNDQIKVSGNLDQLNEVSITGAKEQKVWTTWSKSWNSITARAGQLYKLLDSIGEKGDRTYVNAEFEKLNQRLIDSVQVLIKKYPASAVTPYVIIDRFITYPNPEKAASSFAVLAPTAKNSIYGKELAEAIRINAKTGIGVKPDFTLPNVDGKLLQLSSLRGKIVLVDFWASWCVPCRKENPNLVNAYTKYHDKGFEIIGISLDHKKEAWVQAIAADQLNWLHVSDLKGWKSTLALEYGIKSIPMNFLVDASGKIIAKDLRGEQLTKKLASLMK